MQKQNYINRNYKRRDLDILLVKDLPYLIRLYKVDFVDFLEGVYRIPVQNTYICK